MNNSQRKNFRIAGLCFLVLLAAALIAPSLSVQAADVKEAVQLNAGITLTDNLVALKGKAVTVNLAAGQTLSGIVNDVKNGLLHLEKLSQKDFYDALVPIDKIASIEVRVR
jgi:hypothetical protein